jgi:hypothetical protein
MICTPLQAGRAGILNGFTNWKKKLRIRETLVAGHLLLFVQVLALLGDPELPVRVDSVVSLRSIIDAAEDTDSLKPVLPVLLNSIFSLMNQVRTFNSARYHGSGKLDFC